MFMGLALLFIVIFNVPLQVKLKMRRKINKDKKNGFQAKGNSFTL